MVTLRKLTTISKYFFKKNTKDIISFSVILLIATILFSSALTINNNINAYYDKEFTRLNTADVFFTIPNREYNSNLLEDIKNIKGVKNASVEKGIMLKVPVNMDGSTQEQTQIFYNLNNIKKREIIKENKSTNFGIYLSNYTFIHSNLNLKDKYQFNINNISYTFNIKGVINEMQYGNYTSSVIGEYLEDLPYKYLLNQNLDKEVATISLNTTTPHTTYNTISKYLNNKNINILNKNYKENIKNSRLAISNILVLILTAFSSIILIISLFVSKFKIEQCIEEEMSNMGVLEALGYTSKEIILANIFPYIASGLLFTALGIITSYSLLPLLSKVIEMQSGLIWRPRLDLFSNMIVLIINLTLIIIFTLVAALKIKKLNPINAIRGLTNHNSAKNYFEIEKTKGNIHFILILKNFINTKKQNILLGLVLFFVTTVTSFIGILFYNININPLNFINTLVEEHPSVVITSNTDLRARLKKEPNVKNAIYYDDTVALNYKGNPIKTFVSESFNNLANDLCYEGRNPDHDNEIAIGSKLQETYNINIGDNILLSKDGIQNNYKVVGFIQSVNYSGEIIEITIDGYKKVSPTYSPKIIYTYLDNENTSTKFINTIKNKYSNYAILTNDYAKSMDSAVWMYVWLISIITIIMIIITLLLIYLVLYITISSIILRRKQELGIFKALGYENKQLIKQLVGGFIPSTIISTALGILVGKLFMHTIYLKIFNSVGAYKVSFEYPFIIFIIVAVFLILSTIIIAHLLARKIKNISVYSLIKD